MSAYPKNQSELLDAYLNEATEPVAIPTKTYRLNFGGNSRLAGMIDDVEALKQFIRKAILTCRSKYNIYSDDYGCELEQLIGEDVTDAFLAAEVPRMIRETIVYDDRINAVIDVRVTRKGDSIFIAVDVDSIYGTVTEEVTL